MPLVELRPGDTLSIVWSSVQETPFGVKEVESNFAFTYDDIISKLQSPNRVSKSRRSSNEGARFSRVVALTNNALHKGTWSTGAEINRSEVFRKLLQRFYKLSAVEYPNITQNAKSTLLRMFKNQNMFLSEIEASQLREIVQKLEVYPKDHI